jgi:hypothetical protein
MPRCSLVAFAAALAGHVLPEVGRAQEAARAGEWARAGAQSSFRRQAMTAWAATHAEWAAAHSQLVAWLVARQDESGRLPAAGPREPVAPADVAASALAMLAFASDGSTMRQGAHKDPIKKATIWLKNQQRDDGWFCASDDASAALVQGLAAAAMVQVCVDSRYLLLDDPARRALAPMARFANGDGAGTEPVALAFATLGARHLPAAGDELAGAALPVLARQLGANGVAVCAAGAFPRIGASAATPELATFAVAMAASGTPAMPADAPAMQRFADRVSTLPGRLGGNGELADGLLLLCASDVAFDVGGGAWDALRLELDHRVLPRLRRTGTTDPAAATARPVAITFACGPAVLRNETAESALVALALAVPWYRLGR